MPFSTEYELMRQARSDLESVRRMLLAPTPASIDSAVPLLEGAASKLAWLEGRLTAAAPDRGRRDQLRSETLAVKRSIVEVRALVSQASDFFLGWAALVGLAAPGYGPASARVIAARTVTFEG